MRHMLAAFALNTLVLAHGVAAQDTGTVVELYTSQGCSSCPPADDLLAQIADRSDVIALALHVDYWDYIGHVDDLANPAYSQRQRQYAQAWQARNIYTPQMVVAGVEEFVGSHEAKVTDYIAAHPVSADPVSVGAVRSGDTLSITAQVRGAVPDAAVVQVVRYIPEQIRAIPKGENAGKTIVYRNVVTRWEEVGHWDTARPLSMQVDVTGDLPVVVIVQDGTSGPILGAVRLR